MVAIAGRDELEVKLDAHGRNVRADEHQDQVLEDEEADDDPDSEVPDEGDEDEDEIEDGPDHEQGTKSERRLAQLARQYAAAHGVSYPDAYGIVILSPLGQKLYQRFILEERDPRTRSGV